MWRGVVAAVHDPNLECVVELDGINEVEYSTYLGGT